MVFSGVILSLFNATLEATPEKNRTSFLAYHQTIINLMAVFAPIVGVGLRDLYGFQIAFLICAALRIGGAFSFKVLQQYEKRHSTEAVI